MSKTITIKRLKIDLEKFIKKGKIPPPLKK